MIGTLEEDTSIVCIALRFEQIDLVAHEYGFDVILALRLQLLVPVEFASFE